MRLHRPRRRDAAGLLDDAYQERLEALGRLRVAHAHVQAAVARAQRERRSALAAVDRLESKARKALNDGDEAAARAAAAACMPLDAAVTQSDEQLRPLVRTEKLLAGAVALTGQQIDTIRRRREALGDAATADVLAAVRADLEALATAYEPVRRTLAAAADNPDGAGSSPAL